MRRIKRYLFIICKFVFLLHSRRFSSCSYHLAFAINRPFHSRYIGYFSHSSLTPSSGSTFICLELELCNGARIRVRIRTKFNVTNGRHPAPGIAGIAELVVLSFHNVTNDGIDNERTIYISKLLCVASHKMEAFIYFVASLKYYSSTIRPSYGLYLYVYTNL